MDPLLSLLETSGIGLSVNNLHAGGFIHADDITALAYSSNSLQRQITFVEDRTFSSLICTSVRSLLSLSPDLDMTSSSQMVCWYHKENKLSVWVTGGKETYLPIVVWSRILERPKVVSSTTAHWDPFRVILTHCQRNQLLIPVSRM